MSEDRPAMPVPCELGVSAAPDRIELLGHDPFEIGVLISICESITATLILPP